MSQHGPISLEKSVKVWEERAWAAFKTQLPILLLFSLGAPLLYQTLIFASAPYMALPQVPLVTWWLALPYVVQVLLEMPVMVLLSIPLVFASAGPMPK